MNANTGYPFDHAVISVRDQLDAAVTTFSRLGFRVTPRGFHTLGSINHLIVLATTYIELIGFAPGEQTIRADLRAAAAGLNGLVFRSHDATQTFEQASARGAPVSAPQQFSRPVDLRDAADQPGQSGAVRACAHASALGAAGAADASGAARSIWPDAVFRTVRTPVGYGPAGRLYFCEHLTPELVWREPWRAHPNGALELVGASVESPDVQKTAEQFARLLGAEHVIPAGKLMRVSAPPVTINIAEGPRELMRGLRLSVASLRQTQAWFERSSLSFERESNKAGELLRLSAAQCGGAELEFVEDRIER